MSINPDRLYAAYRFFADWGLAPDEIIKRGKLKGLHPELIERAMIVVSERFDQTKDKPRDLAWQVWRTSQEMKAKIYYKGRDMFQRQRDEIDRLTSLMYSWAVYGIILTYGIVGFLAWRFLW
jgi:hypothetical protein